MAQALLAAMYSAPHDTSFDSTYALLREGYGFVPRRCRMLDTDIFEARLMLEPASFISGEEAAEIFYSDRFERRGALPRRVQRTLTGSGGVQMLDGAAHHERKAMFMALMNEESRHALQIRVQAQWQRRIAGWAGLSSVTLFTEVQEILFQAACDWAGIPYRSEEVAGRACDLGRMIDGFGGVGLRQWRGRAARRRMEAWACGIIEQVRGSHLPVAADHALYCVAMHHTGDERMLPRQVAAVELLNLIRPIVAIATYVTFIGHALHAHPEWRERLRQERADEMECFVQEVRRFYPFTPFVGARVKEAFDWKGCHFPKGRLVILDVYGIDHDPRRWQEPEVFRPERFRDWRENAFGFIPQGGGHHLTGHRCAGEWITIDTMKTFARLVAGLDYSLPSQDLTIDLTRIPTRPASGIVMSDIRQAVPVTGVSQNFSPASRQPDTSHRPARRKSA